MIYLFRLMFLHEVKKNYPNRKFILFQIASTLIVIWVYYMTAKTISIREDLTLEWYGFDYFHFLITGEAALLLPEAAMAAHSRVIRLSMHTKFNWELLRKSWSDSLRQYTVMSMSVLNLAAVELILFIACASFFQSQISIMQLVKGLIYIAASLPCFIILGIAVSSMVLATGRGQGLVTQMMFVLQVLAGVYFPVEIFGELSHILKVLLPHSFLLNGARLILANQGGAQIWIDLLQYQLFFIVGFAPLSLALYYWAQFKVRKDSAPVLVYH